MFSNRKENPFQRCNNEIKGDGENAATKILQNWNQQTINDISAKNTKPTVNETPNL